MASLASLDQDVVSSRDSWLHGVIQTNAWVGPGSSGCPLLDCQGRLIGNMVGSAPGKMAGINFAIPVDTVKRVVTQIIRDGKTTTPSVGITVMDAALQEAIEIQSSVMFDGAVIESVMPESLAAEAGFVGLAKSSAGDGWDLGDLIVGADGKRAQKKGDFQSVLDAKEPGDIIQLTISRADDRSKHVVIAVKVTREEE